MNIIERALAPTPAFFKKLRFLGLILTTASGILIGGGTIQPGVVLEIIQHIASAGAVLIAVSQITVEDSALASYQAERAESHG